MAKKFKAGDLVYFPYKNHDIHLLTYSENEAFPLKCEDYLYTFNSHGQMTSSANIFPMLFKATRKNRKLLSKLYGVEFKKPRHELTGSDKVRELLKSGKPVLCGVSQQSQQLANEFASDFYVIDAVKTYSNNVFITAADGTWRYASPVDLNKVGNK